MTALDISERIHGRMAWLVEFGERGGISDRRIFKLRTMLCELLALRGVLRLTRISGTEITAWDMMEDLYSLSLDRRMSIEDQIRKLPGLSEAVESVMASTEAALDMEDRSAR